VANRRNFFFDQLVEEDELDAAFDGVEQADFNQNVDLGLIGITTGLAAAQHSPTADLTVDVAVGNAYDKQGRRLNVPSLQVVNLAVDSNSVSTSVVNVGNSKIVSLFLRFKRNQGDQRTDGNAVTVYFVQDEGFEFFVEQGAEAVTPTPPALRNDSILLADITRTFGQTQIVNANISGTRREHQFVLAAGSLTVAAGTPEASDQAVLTHLNNHVTGVANLHPASAVDYAGGSAWADGVTNPATTVEAQIDKILSELASTSGSGADKIGIKARTAWRGGGTNPAGTLFSAIDAIITDLALQTASNDGAERIGAQASGGLAAGSVRSQLDELDNEKGGVATANNWTQPQEFAEIDVGSDATFQAQLILSGGGEESPAILDCTRALTNYTQILRVLIDAIPTGSYGRFMGIKNEPGTADEDTPYAGNLLFTTNAKIVSSQWNRDASGDSWAFAIGGTGGDAQGGITVLYRDSTSASAWTDWEQHIHVSPLIPNANNANVSHTLTPKNMCSAWVRARTDGAGNVSVVDGFNVSGVGISGSNILEITFARAMADANYAYSAMDGTDETVAGFYKTKSVSTTVLGIGRTTDGSAATNLSTTAMDIVVVVTGATS